MLTLATMVEVVARAGKWLLAQGRRIAILGMGLSTAEKDPC